MGRITDEDIARVRDATDLVALVSERVVLRQKGRLFWGNCPFHGEKTPSFKIDPATQLWHCFGCGAGGDAYGFLMRSENMEFPDAVRMLADRGRIEISEDESGVPRGKKDRLWAVLAETADFYHRVLTGSRDKGATTARDYLSNRGFGSDVAKTWNLGFAPGRGTLVEHLTKQGFSTDEMVDANVALRGDSGQLKDRFYERVMFPIADLQGRVIAFGGRVIGPGEPKYLNTNDTPVFHKSANMYAIDRAKGPITATGAAIVVEGYTDVIALHEAGITNAVATLGTALTQQHVKLLGRFAKRVVYLFDGDEAGLRAADRAVEFIQTSNTSDSYHKRDAADISSRRVDLSVAIVPGGHDPASYVDSDGVEAMQGVVASAVPLIQFAIDRKLGRWDLDRPEERDRALSDALEVLVPIGDTETARQYAAGYLAGLLFTEARIVLGRLEAAVASASRRTRQSDEAVDHGGLSLGPELRAGRDLLALLVQRPSLRAQAQELLAQSLLYDPAYEAMAQVIAEAGSGVSPAALVGALEEKVPGAAQVLSGAISGEEGDEEAGVLTHDLTRRLKEFGLERRIAVGKAKLKSPEVVKDKTVSDEIFKEVSALQRELDASRRSAEQ